MDTSATEATWFQDSIEYAGPATARFATPMGTVTGTGQIQTTPYGELVCTMECQTLETEGDLPFGWIQFFENGVPQAQSDGVRAMAVYGGWNTCVEFRLATPSGVFEARSPIHFNYTVGGDKAELKLRFPRSEFVTPTAAAPSYWVVPLFNFVNHFFPAPAPLANHPLRVWVETPAGETDSDSQQRRKIVRWAKDRVVPFLWEGEPAFIERVPAYEERVSELQNGIHPMAITALMVGGLGDAHPQTSIDDWRVLWMLPVMSLACGTEVRTPWIELRAPDGQLTRRIHFRWPLARFRANNTVVTGGVGAMLSGAPFATHFGEPYLRACIRHLIHSTGDGSPLEDRLDHLSRALELLCRIHGFNTNSAYSANLSGTAQARLSEAKVAAATIAASLTESQLIEGLDRDERGLLKELARRVTGAFTLPVGFGKAVEALVSHYGLMDSAVVAQYYSQAPDGQPQRWDQALSRHRNTVIHHGYFEAANIIEIYKFIEHLRDVLTRILLKMVCYVGKYAVGTAKYSGTELSVGWVTRETSPLALGYRAD